MPISKAAAPCCHGRITVYVGSINRAYLSNRIAGHLNCDPPSNPSADRLALASFQLSDEGKYVRGSFSLSPILWTVQRIDRRSSSMTMYEVLDPDEYQATQARYELKEKEPTVSYNEIQGIADRIIEETGTVIGANIGANVEEAEVLPEIRYCYSFFFETMMKEQKERQMILALIDDIDELHIRTNRLSWILKPFLSFQGCIFKPFVVY